MRKRLSSDSMEAVSVAMPSGLSLSQIQQSVKEKVKKR